MSAKSIYRGHDVEYDEQAGVWRYADGEPSSTERACPKCGLTTQSSETPDPCLGRFSGVAGACCGHGVMPGYVAIDYAEMSDLDCAHVDPSGLPLHVAMGVTCAGEGPTESEPPHHRVCWCGDPACAWTLALAAERADGYAQGCRRGRQ